MAMTLRLTEEETRQLQAAAEREHVSMQEVARRAIREHVTRRAEVRDAVLARIVEQDAELLERLAQ